MKIINNYNNKVKSASIVWNNFSNEVKAKWKQISEESYEEKLKAYEDNNQYINAVLKLKTQLNHTILLSELKLIEKKMGRKYKNNTVRYETRIIDLDILFFDNLIVNDSKITLPHPKLYNRNYVLKPFFEKPRLS